MIWVTPQNLDYSSPLEQQFIAGETITGGTSVPLRGTVASYRASPVQNIQQLLAYADVDNTIFDFLEEFRKWCAECSIPSGYCCWIG